MKTPRSPLASPGYWLACRANVGWITFTNRDATGAAYDGPKLDLLTGRLASLAWSDIGLGWIPPDAGGTTSRLFNDTASSQRFFRIQALKPLFP